MCQLYYKETEIDLDMDEDNVGFSSAEASEFCLINSPGKMLYKYIQEIDFLDIRC